MTVFLRAPGKSLLISTGGKPLLFAPFGSGGGGGGGSGGGTLTSVTGLAGWWDASGTPGMLGSSGSAVYGWTASVASILDKRATANLVNYSRASSPVLPVATGRLNGYLGGVGRGVLSPESISSSNQVPSGQYLPIMDPDQGFQLPGKTFGAGADWTICLAWSRPNWRQGGNGSTAPVALANIGGVNLLTLGSTASATSLAVCPTGENVALSSAMSRRHSHAVILSYSHTTNTVTAYLDSSPSGVTATAALGAGGLLTFLHDTTIGGGAQCWFHEAAYWNRALAGSDIAAVQSYFSGRWYLGPRKGYGFICVGQSNAVRMLANGDFHRIASGAGWNLGALACNVFAQDSVTVLGSYGIIPNPLGLPGLLTDPGDGSSPATWLATSGFGLSLNGYVSAINANDLVDVCGVLWPWSESDCIYSYSTAQKAKLFAAQQRLIGLIRSWSGKTAAQLVSMTWNAMPFPYGANDGGMQMVRECEQDLTTLSGFNSAIVLPDTEGVAQSTDAGADHLLYASDTSLARLAAPRVAASRVATAGADVISSVAEPAAATGPFISHVKQINAATYLLTITHDGGTDLVVPSGAAGGIGFAIMDGGTLTAPGTIRNAATCTYVDNTHIQITLQSGAANPAASLLLFYPYGNLPGTWIGQQPDAGRVGVGNTVTDNAASILAANASSIANQLSSAWAVNYPIAATTYGLAVSTT